MPNLSPVHLIHFTLAAFLMASPASAESSISLSDSQALAIGKRIWKNECGGTVSGLTTWNSGEEFPSLGIGHFIWYPPGKNGPFEESFPKLLAFYKANNVNLPGWLASAKDSPWTSRSQFNAAKDSAQMKQLRELLASTVGTQARFAALRLEAALPKMLKAAPASERDKIRTNFYRVANEPMGLYALMDYVNFKGEGTSPSERYKGQGWGLLQVLENMGPGPALPAFAASADKMLTRRVKNSDPSRNEAKWLPGWRNRLATYTN